jgi:mannose-6-phosphate isomerase-like protein (cupin superfamily)
MTSRRARRTHIGTIDRTICGDVRVGAGDLSRPLSCVRGETILSFMSEAFIVPPGEGRQLDLGTFEAVVLATSAQTAGEFTLLQTQSEPSDFGPPLHLHRDAAEAFYVLEGEYLMFLEDQQTRCSPGTFVYVPRATPHTFKVVSPGPGKKLNLFTPAAMTEFFEQLADAEAAGAATPELLNEIAARSHMEVLGPVPDTYL